jgi:decaprenylphospho-beta-D-erythro-pentofuranosid-2-ulose 2-reductase
MKRICIIGATSAIAHETAKVFAGQGAYLFLVARNRERLDAVADDLRVRGARKVETLVADLADMNRHAQLIDAAVTFLDRVDSVLVAHGTLPDQQQCQRDVEEAKEAFIINSFSYISLLTLLAQYFEQQGSGCIAVITSVAGDRGRRSNYLYGAAKAAVSTFLQGLRSRFFNSGVSVVTIKPGFVDTPMTASIPKNFLFASASSVGKRIHRAMTSGKDVVYVPSFWRWIMGGIRLLPECVFKRLNF